MLFNWRCIDDLLIDLRDEPLFYRKVGFVHVAAAGSRCENVDVRPESIR